MTEPVAPAAAPEPIVAPVAPAAPAAPQAAVVASEAKPGEPAAPAAAEPAKGAETILSKEPEAKPVAAPADWPDDWRVKLAGEDKAYLKTLERYDSPAALAKAHRELQVKMSSGQLKAALKADASDEEKATWRKENGLPEKAEAYEPKLPGGVVLGEADAPLLKGFQETAFKAGMTPGQFNEALTWYFGEQDAIQAKQFEEDKGFKSQAEDELRKEWGSSYRAEVAGIRNFLALAPEGVADRLFGGRTADGKLIGDDPHVLKWLASLSREVNPMASLVPAGSADPMKAGEGRIKEIEGMMNSEAYWKDSSVQEEYRALIEARDKTQRRSAA